MLRSHSLFLLCICKIFFRLSNRRFVRSLVLIRLLLYAPLSFAFFALHLQNLFPPVKSEICSFISLTLHSQRRYRNVRPCSSCSASRHRTHTGCRYPCLCLCLGFSQITAILPFLLIHLHLSQIFFTDDLTFIFFSFIFIIFVRFI